MKTAMKEMIQNIIDIESKTYNQEQLYMLTALKVSAIMLLEKEKEQIINAYEDGKENERDSITNIYNYRIAEFYYNQTYNQTNVGNDGFEFDNSSTIPPPKTNNL